jgi:hypothetical protein
MAKAKWKQKGQKGQKRQKGWPFCSFLPFLSFLLPSAFQLEVMTS